MTLAYSQEMLQLKYLQCIQYILISGFVECLHLAIMKCLCECTGHNIACNLILLQGILSLSLADFQFGISGAAEASV